MLELIATTFRALIDASAVVIVLRDGEQLIVAAGAGELPSAIVGARLDADRSLAAWVLRSGRVERLDLDENARFALRERGIRAQAAIVVPLSVRGARLGVIEAFDRVGGPHFRAEDERRLLAAAASAATALAAAQSIGRERLREALHAAEQERRRCARELHDQTLQTLGALRVQLGVAYRRGKLDHWQQTAQSAIAQITEEIANLRAIITDLRPPALDELGLAAAIYSLITRTQALSGLQIDATVKLGPPTGAGGGLDSEVECTVYRVLQEALNNATRHAQAQTLQISVIQADGELQITVRDNGTGFSPQRRHAGSGLTGMRERLALVGGQLQITSGPPGTTVHARIPNRRQPPPDRRTPAGAAAQGAIDPGRNPPTTSTQTHRSATTRRARPSQNTAERISASAPISSDVPVA